MEEKGHVSPSFIIVFTHSPLLQPRDMEAGSWLGSAGGFLGWLGLSSPLLGLFTCSSSRSSLRCEGLYGWKERAPGNLELQHHLGLGYGRACWWLLDTPFWIVASDRMGSISDLCQFFFDVTVTRYLTGAKREFDHSWLGKAVRSGSIWGDGSD